MRQRDRSTGEGHGGALVGNPAGGLIDVDKPAAAIEDDGADGQPVEGLLKDLLLSLVALDPGIQLAASLRDIAEKAQVSTRTLYNHFPDKPTLFAACLEYSGELLRFELPDFKGDLRTELITYATEMQRQLSFDTQFAHRSIDLSGERRIR